MVTNSMVHWSISLICPGPAVHDQVMGSLGPHIDTRGECVRGDGVGGFLGKVSYSFSSPHAHPILTMLELFGCSSERLRHLSEPALPCIVLRAF